MSQSRSGPNGSELNGACFQAVQSKRPSWHWGRWARGNLHCTSSEGKDIPEHRKQRAQPGHATRITNPTVVSQGLSPQAMAKTGPWDENHLSETDNKVFSIWGCGQPSVTTKMTLYRKQFLGDEYGRRHNDSLPSKRIAGVKWAIVERKHLNTALTQYQQPGGKSGVREERVREEQQKTNEAPVPLGDISWSQPYC